MSGAKQPTPPPRGRRPRPLQAPPRVVRTSVHEVTCIGCGCTDSHACEGAFGEGCHWISQNAKTRRGICSECAITMFNAILFPA